MLLLLEDAARWTLTSHNSCPIGFIFGATLSKGCRSNRNIDD